MKINFSFNYICDTDEIWLEYSSIPRVGEFVYYKDVKYTVTRVTYNAHQTGLGPAGYIGKISLPYINLEIVPRTLKEKLCVSWRKLLKLMV